jgi:MGT family glycosyltransferase
VRIFQTLVAFSGNAPPQLAVTAELVRRGHEVQVLAHRPARDRIERTGAEFVAFEKTLPDLDITRNETDSVRDWEAKTKLGAGARFRDAIIGSLRDNAAECSALIGEERPDVVVYDFLFAGAGIAAEAAAIPAAALVHCPYPLPVSGAPPLFSGMAPRSGRVGALRDGLFNRLTERFLNAGLQTLNGTRAEHGLPALRTWSDGLAGADAVLVLTAPELDFSSRASLPANVEYVGPAFEPYEPGWTSPWPDDNHDPLVVISFSTSYMNQLGMAQRVLDGVDGLRVRALLTTGPSIDGSHLRLPANARAVSFVPHRAVLPQAALVVTHAGWQTVNAALADGVPLVCIPDGRDQPDNAARVVAAGAGVRIPKNSPPDRVRQAVTGALADPGLRRGAETMAKALARSDGAVATADRLEQLASSTAAPGHAEAAVRLSR